jgi:hypothetical protein
LTVSICGAFILTAGIAPRRPTSSPMHGRWHRRLTFRAHGTRALYNHFVNTDK